MNRSPFFPFFFSHFFVLLLVVVVISSGCVTQNPYRLKIGGKDVDFRANLDEARKVPVYPSELEIKKALLGTNNSVMARAAQLIARAGDKGLIPTLIEAFGHLLQMPAAADKSCRAKSAIVEALDDLGDDPPLSAELEHGVNEAGSPHASEHGVAFDQKDLCALAPRRQRRTDPGGTPSDDEDVHVGRDPRLARGF